MVRLVLLQRVPTISRCDITAPTVTITSPADGATYTVGEYIDTVFTCTDPALRTCDGTPVNGQAADTSRVGTYTVEVFADDTSGNATTARVTYTVAAQSPLTVLPNAETSALMSALAAAITVDLDGDPATPDQPAVSVPVITGPTITVNGCTIPTPATDTDAALLLSGQAYQSRTGPAPAQAPQCRPAAVTTTQRP